MNIFHIGTIALETEKTDRELKAIGGISGYILELINYTKSKNNNIGFIGKVYNYEESSSIKYFQVQEKLSSTNKFLIKLFLKSARIKLPKNSIIHAHRPDHLAAFLFLNRKPSIVTLHGQQALTVNIRKGYWVRKIYNTLEKFALKRVKKIIAVDSVTKKYYSELYPQHEHKICTIPTGVNTELFFPTHKSEVKKVLGFNESTKLILYVGRIEPPKKIDVIIKAFSKIVTKDKVYKLVLVGDGISRHEMEELSQKLEISEYVKFLGIRKRSELPILFNAADVSVLISGNEGSPLSVKESLACGIPVVANNVGDIASIVKDDYNGYIVSSDNIEEIADKLMSAAAKKVEFQMNCISSIQPYTIPSVSEKVLNLYKEIANE